MTPISHPGGLLKRELQARGLSANRLALDIGVPSGRVTDILNGPPFDHSRYGGTPRSLLWQRCAILDRSPKPVRHRPGSKGPRSRNRRTCSPGRCRVILSYPRRSAAPTVVACARRPCTRRSAPPSSPASIRRLGSPICSAASPRRRRAGSTNSCHGTEKTASVTIRLRRPRPRPSASSPALRRRQTQPERPRGLRQMLSSAC